MGRFVFAVAGVGGGGPGEGVDAGEVAAEGADVFEGWGGGVAGCG
jgi:hypothetical protein